MASNATDPLKFNSNGNTIVIKNVESLQRGNVINYNFPPQTDAEKKIKELEVKLYQHLKNLHTEENRIVQCLPNDEDEVLMIETHFSPLKITDESGRDVELGDVIRNEKKIHISGDAGMGKSTFCKKMCYDWGFGGENNYLDRFKFVFYIPLRLVGGNSIKKYVFDSILDDDDVMEFTKVDVSSLLNKHEKKILFLLDGLDEVGNWEKLLRDVFKNYPSSTFVISSRFSWDQTKLKDEKFKRCLVLNGFTDEGVEIFQEKYFHDAYPRKEFFIDKLVKSTDLCAKKCIENFKCPLFLQLLCYYFKFSDPNRREPLKVTQLYEEMFDILRKKYEEKEKIPLGMFTLHEKLLQMGEIAFEALTNDVILFDQDQIEDVVLVKLGFLRQETFRGSDNRKKKKFQPVHKTFLEFLAALYMKGVLMADKQRFIESIVLLPDSAIHSRKAKSGSKFSLFIVFLCGLLGDNAYLFFKILDTIPKFSDRFKNTLNIVLLLWHSGESEKNIEYLVQSERFNSNCLNYFVERSYDNEINNDWLILSGLLRHQKCILKKINVNECTLMKFTRKCRELLVESLRSNQSINQLELAKIGTSPYSAEVGEDVAMEHFEFFIDIVKSVPNVQEIIVNQDVFTDKLGAHALFFDVFMVGLSNLGRLEKLSVITSPMIYETCDVLCGEYVGNANGVMENTKKGKKKKKPRLSKQHCELFTRNVSLQLHSLRELQLSRLDVEIDFVSYLVDLIDLRVLKLPFVQCATGLNGIWTLLSKKDAKLEHLSLTGYDFKNGEFKGLIDALKTNNSLQYLNLAHTSSDQNGLSDLFAVLKSNTALRCLNLARTEFSRDALPALRECLETNGVLERLNLSFKDAVIDDEDMGLLLSACKMSQLKELHLSGWEFVIKNVESFKEIVENLVGFGKIETFCIKNSKFSFSSSSDEISGVVVDFLNNLMSGEMFKHLDAKKFCVQWVKRPLLSKMDSGYSSPDPIGDQFDIWGDGNIKYETKELKDLSEKIKKSEKINFWN